MVFCFELCCTSINQFEHDIHFCTATYALDFQDNPSCAICLSAKPFVSLLATILWQSSTL
jgi:hypothetical protein